MMSDYLNGKMNGSAPSSASQYEQHPEDVFGEHEEFDVFDKLDEDERGYAGMQVAVHQPSLPKVSHPSPLWDKAFEGFPDAEKWRLFIDTNRQEEGPSAFDKTEPGYALAMQNALDYASRTVCEPLSVSELTKLHDICIDGIYSGARLIPKGMGGVQRYGLSKGHIAEILLESRDRIQVGSPPVTPEALLEWSSERLVKYSGSEQDDKEKPCLAEWLPDHQQIASNVRGSPAEKTEVLEERINGYYESISTAKNDNEKMLAIVRLCRALEMAHVFSDGNQRTIVFVLLNRLLIENRLSPVILGDPYVFDGYLSAEQLVAEVIRGQTNFNSYKTKKGLTS